MILLIFLLSIKSKENENTQTILYGNWSDTSLIDETYLFFNYTHPNLIPKVTKLIGNLTVNQYDYIIKRLNGHIPQEILGLLQLSLSLRYFHPQALKNQNYTSKSTSIIRGWAGIIKQSLSNIQLHNFQWKFLNYIYSATGSENKLKRLASVNNPSDYLPIISNNFPNSAIIEEFTRLKLEQTHLSLINGRSVSNDPHEILDALLNEYQNMLILKELGIDIAHNRSLIEKILSGKPEHEVFEYIPPLEKVPLLERHEAATSRAKWGPTLKTNETNPIIFLQNSKSLVKTQIFINIHSKESAPILDYILEETVKEFPYGYEVALIADLNNETEKKIAFSFLTSLMNIGTRSSIEYLLDGILHGYEKAYKKTRPVFPWKDLLEEPAYSTIYQFVKKQHDYAEKYGIDNFTIIVNGNVVREKPSFTEMKYHILDQGRRLLESAKRGFFKESTDLDKYLSENGIPISKVNDTLKIDMNNKISIDNMPINSIIEIVKFLGKKFSKKPYFESNTDISPIPVYYVNCKPPLLEELSFESPPFILNKISKKKDFPKSVLKILRNAKTVVGPLIFDRALSASELRYAIYYVKLAFMEQIDNEKLSKEQLLYILLWRSSLGLRGIDRSKNPKISSSSIISTKSELPIIWYSIMNPFSPEYRMTIEMINHVSELNIASIVHIPSVPLGQMPSISTDKFIPIIFDDGINHDDINGIDSMELETPSNWAVVKKGQNYMVTHVVTYGFAYGAEKISINNEIKVPLQKNGYFITLLPIGKYSTIGLKEKAYFVDSFISRPKFYTAQKNLSQESISMIDSLLLKKNEYLNVFSYSSSYEFENFTKMMLYSLIQNSTKKIKFWCISGFRNGIPKGVETVVLSKFWPHFLPKPKDSIAFCKAAKFALLDLIFSPDIDNVLAVDQETVFRGDASVFEKLDLNDYESALALPLISSDPKDKSKYWNQRFSIVERFKRPFHVSAIAWFNMKLWRQCNGGSLYRDLYSKIMRNEVICFEIDNAIVNILQLQIQIASLPKETVYCSSYSKKENVDKAFAILQNYNDIPGILGKEYDELINAAINVFDI